MPLIIAQLSMTVAALLLLMLWPPVSGRILLVPLVHRDASRVVNVALAGGAALLGPGPLAGSIVVVGERSRIATQMRSWDFVMVAAPPTGCGSYEQVA